MRPGGVRRDVPRPHRRRAELPGPGDDPDAQDVRPHGVRVPVPEGRERERSRRRDGVPDARLLRRPPRGLELLRQFHLDDVQDQKVAMQYIPEKLLVQESMPSTASGKIQKFKLREMIAELVKQAQ